MPVNSELMRCPQMAAAFVWMQFTTLFRIVRIGEWSMDASGKVRLHAYLGRFLLSLAVLALLGAWGAQLLKHPVLGMSQQHLYSDATVLALLGIGSFLDALWHSRSSM